MFAFFFPFFSVGWIAVEFFKSHVLAAATQEPEKKRAIEDFMGEISEETFAKLTNLSKKVTDFTPGEEAAGETGLDDKLGVNVVIDEEEEEEEVRVAKSGEGRDGKWRRSP